MKITHEDSNISSFNIETGSDNLVFIANIFFLLLSFESRVYFNFK